MRLVVRAHTLRSSQMNNAVAPATLTPAKDADRLSVRAAAEAHNDVEGTLGTLGDRAEDAGVVMDVVVPPPAVLHCHVITLS